MVLVFFDLVYLLVFLISDCRNILRVLVNLRNKLVKGKNNICVDESYIICLRS